MSAVSGQPVSYQPWGAGQPNGGRHQACAEAKIDRTRGMEVETYQGYNDLNCAKERRQYVQNLLLFYGPTGPINPRGLGHNARLWVF